MSGLSIEVLPVEPVVQPETFPAEPETPPVKESEPWVLPLPVVMGCLMGTVIIVAVVTFALQKRVSDKSLDTLGFSLSEQFFHSQRNRVEAYFRSVESLLEGPRMALTIGIASVAKDSYLSMRPVLGYLARSTIEGVNMHFAEAHVVDYEHWDRSGQYRAHSFGIGLQGSSDSITEWNGTQPGMMVDYALDANLTRVNESHPYLSTDFEPVVFQARTTHGFGIQKTFMYNASGGEQLKTLRDAFTGIFFTFWEGGRMRYYINVQFSVRNVDGFLSHLPSDYPYSMAIVEMSTGEIVGDSDPNPPYRYTTVFRLTYQDSPDVHIREGGAHAFRHVKTTGTEFMRMIGTIGGEECYIGFQAIRVEGLEWLMLGAVIPLRAVRGAVDDINLHITVSIAIVFAVVGITSIAVLVWISASAISSDGVRRVHEAK